MDSHLNSYVEQRVETVVYRRVDVVLRGALVPDGGTSGPGDRSSSPGTSGTPRRPA